MAGYDTVRVAGLTVRIEPSVLAFDSADLASRLHVHRSYLLAVALALGLERLKALAYPALREREFPASADPSCPPVPQL